MKLSVLALLIITAICGCKQEDNSDNIRFHNLMITVKDEFTGAPVPNLPITIYEIENSDGGWFTPQNEIFKGKTNVYGNILLNSPVRKDRHYRFFKNNPADTDTLSADWSYFLQEHFIRGDTFPAVAEITFRPSGAIWLTIADSSFARTGAVQ